MFLGRYEVIRKIGSGGFGEVLLARALGAEGFERIVALKRLKGDLARKAGSLKGIINEARIGGLLNHPNIVQVLEFIHLEPDFLLVMEYVDGISVQDLLDLERESGSFLTHGLALDIAIQTCEGLHYAHTARSITSKPLKLVHRDIKPSNIMITRTGTVKIMDFGVARSSTNLGQSSTGSIKGTLRYLSPEQAEGSKEIGRQSDIFSLGLVLCEMIIGHPVYEAEQEHLVLLKALQAETAGAVEEAEALLPGLGPILTRCLAHDPGERFPTADALGQALRRLRKDLPVGVGLSEMVERAMASRKGVTGEGNELSEEDSFSLELRLKGMDRRPSERTLRLLDPDLGTSDGLDAHAERGLEVQKVKDGGQDEPWEWEWRVTTYPSTRSELEGDDDADFTHVGVGESSGEGGATLAHLPGAVRRLPTPEPVSSLATHPRGPGRAPGATPFSVNDLPFDARSQGGARDRLQAALSRPLVQVLLALLLAVALLATGFGLGIRKGRESCSDTGGRVEIEE